MLAVVWEYPRPFRARARGPARDPAAQRFAINLLVAFLPAALLGLAFAKPHQAAPVPRRAGRGRVHRRRPDHPLGRALRRGASRWSDVDDMTWLDALKVGFAQCVRADPRHVALGRDDHRRHAVRAVAPRRDRVLVLPRGADADRGRRLRLLQEPRALSTPPISACSPSGSSSRSSRRSCACAGCSATSRRTTSACSPGIASRSGRCVAVAGYTGLHGTGRPGLPRLQDWVQAVPRRATRRRYCGAPGRRGRLRSPRARCRRGVAGLVASSAALCERPPLRQMNSTGADLSAWSRELRHEPGIGPVAGIGQQLDLDGIGYTPHVIPLARVRTSTSLAPGALRQTS